MDLHSLSPLDGRYREDTAPLREFFSESAYLRARAGLELTFLAELARTGLIPASQVPAVRSLGQGFSDEDDRRMQHHEQATRHDVKAIEYFLREKLPPEIHPYIHLGLTSEDINNIALAVALRESRDRILLPAMDEMLAELREFVSRYRALPFLARTHGQPAVPTTLGKEVAVYLVRLVKCRRQIADHRFEAKLAGAAGNLNALHASAPQIDWMAFSRDFVEGLGLEVNLFSTQILPYDNWVRYFDWLRLANTILIGYTQDIWRYISDGIMKQKMVEGEVGSSTMPQKVNPIDFENAEGNLGVANALLTHYAQKLPVSRLQRDLSDSTVRRTFGSALGHTLLAWKNVVRGMARVDPDEERLQHELDQHWEVIGEGAQTILRLAGQPDAYESLKKETRGRVLDENTYHRWVSSLDVESETRARLLGLTPRTYIGLAVRIAEEALNVT